MASDVLGRGSEQRWIASEIEAVSAGRRRTIVIRGEPGIGKTALIDIAVDSLVSLGFTTCMSSGREIERHRPFGAIRRALDIDGSGATVPSSLLALERRVGEVEQDARGIIDLPELGFQWIDALHDIVDSMLSSAPVALVIDDAQWADDASVLSLIALHDRLHDRPLLILLATRPTSPDRALERLLSGVRPDDLVDLGPLDFEDVTALITETLGHPPTTHELARVQRAGGNPLFIKTLIAAGGSASSDDDDLPDSVRRLVSLTVHELGDDARHLLEMAAIVGRPVPLKTLALHLDRPLPEVADTTERILASALLVGRADGVAFRHDLVRDVIYTSIQPSVRAALHVAVGERMLEDAVPVADVATHFLLGAQLGDIGAAGVLRSAATQVERVAPAMASQLLERALEILPPDHEDHEAVMVQLIRSSVFSDRLGIGVDLLDKALSMGVQPAHEAELRNVRAQISFLSGEPRRAATEFSMIAALRHSTKREPVILADAAVSAMFAIDFEQARSFADQSLVASRRLADSPVQSLAYGVLAWLTSLSGDLDGGLALACRAVELADGVEGHRRIPHLFHAQCLLWSDRTADAAASLLRGRSLSVDLGMGWDEPMYHALAADERMRSGEWDDALAEIDAGLRRSDEVGSHFADSWLFAHRARILFGRGEFEQSGRALDQAMLGLAGTGGQGADQVWWIRGLLASMESPIEGLGILRVLWNRLDELGVVLRALECAPDVVAVGLKAKDREFAESVVERVGELAAAHPSDLGDSSTAHCQAVLSSGSHGLSEVAAGYDRRCLPLEAIRVRADAARAARSNGGSDLPFDMTGLSNELDELGAQGLRLWHLGDTSSAGRRPSSGWTSLTRSEVAVVELVGRGRSNAEIAERLSISRRTVESHLYHVYPKLRLSTRIELALEAARRSDAPLSRGEP